MSCSFRFPYTCSLSPRQEILCADVTANQSCLPVNDGHAHQARVCHPASNKFLSGPLDSGSLSAQNEQLQRCSTLPPQSSTLIQGLTLNSLWGQAILHEYLRPAARELGIETQFGWHTFRHTYSTLLRSVWTEFKVMQELLRHSTIRSTLDVYTQAITPAKQNAQAAVMSLVSSSQ
jgi:hypothetical protein